MEKFIWDNTYSVGIPSIDKQHKNIIKAINSVAESIEGTNKKPELLSKLFKALLAYSEIHFKYEEELLRKYKFSDTKTHFEEHNKYIKEIKELYNEFETDPGNSRINMKVLEFLNNWLISHIMKTDTQYMSYLKSKGVT